MYKREDIQIRDPFIVPIKEEEKYYMFGTTDQDPWNGDGEGFKVYTSKDLETFEDLGFAFKAKPDFWGKKNFWAPEVHRYRDRWIMLASFKDEHVCRGVQVFSSEKVEGPYLPVTDYAVTPADWECLDGTLYVEDDIPYLVFSHEWLQIKDGSICYEPLSEDLSHAIGKPVTLFHASEAPWTQAYTGDQVRSDGDCYVTDGPFLYKDGKNLKMLWSSFCNNDYAIAICKSQSGKLSGPWIQQDKPYYLGGGHGMLFNDFNGMQWLAIHSPNTSGDERLKTIVFN